MSTRDELDKFITPEIRVKVDAFVADCAGESDDMDMDEVVRRNLADHAAAMGDDPEPAGTVRASLAQLDYLEAVLDIFNQADSYESLMWRRPDDGFRFAAMCSDTFAWGTADAERIEPEDVPLLRQCLADLKAADPQLGECDLPELFAARKRGMRPMRLFLYPKHHREDPGWPAVRELFLAAGPERDPATEG